MIIMIKFVVLKVLRIALEHRKPCVVFSDHTKASRHT